MRHNPKLLIANIFALLIFLISCQKDINREPLTEEQTSAANKKPDDPGFTENNMVMFWNEKTATVLGAAMIQPNRTRYFAMIQIAVHDALNSIKPKYERYALLNEREQFANPDAAVIWAAYTAIVGLGRQGNFPVTYWRDSCLETIPAGESKDLGKKIGEKAAAAIISKRSNDGFTQVTQAATIPLDGDEAGEFRSPVFGPSLIYLNPPVKRIPNWGAVMKPYVTESNSQFRPLGPYSINSAEYTTDFNEIKTKGAKVGGIRTAEEERQARFWSDNRPSLIWNLFTREAIKTKKMDAWKTARLFALMHTCMAESINTQLEAGYYFYFWRPETAIRLATTDGNENTTADNTWLPFISEVPNTFPTPPVPGYPNGYAAYGGTTAEILKLFFGIDQTFISLTSSVAGGGTTNYTSFSDAARDNSLSQIYTGWDFRTSALAGEEMGRRIAAYVFTHAFREE
jgi:hypothetical protein